jgi:hypothetical protein
LEVETENVIQENSPRTGQYVIQENSPRTGQYVIQENSPRSGSWECTKGDLLYGKVVPRLPHSKW